jgi:hypothetical protein
MRYGKYKTSPAWVHTLFASVAFSGGRPPRQTHLTEAETCHVPYTPVTTGPSTTLNMPFRGLTTCHLHAMHNTDTIGTSTFSTVGENFTELWPWRYEHQNRSFQLT